MMTASVLMASLVSMDSVPISARSPQSDHPFGQEPILEPRLVAEGIISTEGTEAQCTLSPDGKSFYFTKFIPGFYGFRDVLRISRSAGQNGQTDLFEFSPLVGSAATQTPATRFRADFFRQFEDAASKLENTHRSLARQPGITETEVGLASPPQASQHERVVIESEGWKIVGDLLVPRSPRPVPAVLMLNGVARDRTPYRELADELARLGIASLRVDLRGHGESTNLGKFVPYQTLSLLEESDRDVAAALELLRGDKRIDPARVGLVGASYSGEAMMVAGKRNGYGAAYVALSPGSLSDESIAAIDKHKLPWLLVVSRHERHLKEVAQALRDQSRTAEFLELSGTEHATNLLGAHTDLSVRIAVWFRHKLRAGD